MVRAVTGRYARQTHYLSPPGNFAAAEVMPVGALSDQWFFPGGIDVLAMQEAGGVVVLGDSLTAAQMIAGLKQMAAGAKSRASGFLPPR